MASHNLEPKKVNISFAFQNFDHLSTKCHTINFILFPVVYIVANGVEKRGYEGSQPLAVN